MSDDMNQGIEKSMRVAPAFFFVCGSLGGLSRTPAPPVTVRLAGGSLFRGLVTRSSGRSFFRLALFGSTAFILTGLPEDLEALSALRDIRAVLAVGIGGWHRLLALGLLLGLALLLGFLGLGLLVGLLLLTER
ncbi:hypothetical protein CNMCM5623_001676 [Aspergillus felis]|uniref:Uncharacterized protein n=1 Tax=Aspergillus felis TaxID=1287682 RepID=A0A8H6QA12_9EURO|nr:hypothetical protein CNMCM5623_001676 [Aspergillus felis]KAF7182631.1 hypothetical protein CNMCM7691_002292 [Aspergillus felis]